MKRIIIMLISIIILLSGCTSKEEYELSESLGRVLLCKDDTFMLICDGSPTVLEVDGLDVESYSDGDLVRVWHDMVLTTYPGRTKAHKIELVEKGDISDIDEDVIQSLCEMGWIENTVINDSETTENYTMCEYLYCRMGLELPENWIYEINKNESECTIKFRPEVEDNGWVVLQCTADLFLVCGTSLSVEEDNIGGYRASVSYYNNNKQFSFIRFPDVPGEYIIRNMENHEWYGKYESDLKGILETLILSSDTVSYEEIYTKVESLVPKYENIITSFNCFSGRWTVDVYIDSVRYQVEYDNAGNPITELTRL